MHRAVQTDTFSRVARNAPPQSVGSRWVIDFWQHQLLCDLKIAFALEPTLGEPLSRHISPRRMLFFFSPFFKNCVLSENTFRARLRWYFSFRSWTLTFRDLKLKFGRQISARWVFQSSAFDIFCTSNVCKDVCGCYIIKRQTESNSGFQLSSQEKDKKI